MRSKPGEGRPARRAFSAEFKVEAVRMMRERRTSGMSLAQISRELAVRLEQLRLWARLQAEGTPTVGPVPGETLEQENRRLRRELATLKQEQAFVKKVRRVQLVIATASASLVAGVRNCSVLRGRVLSERATGSS